MKSVKKDIKKDKIDRGEHYPLIGNFVHYHIYKNNIKKADVARSLGVFPHGLTAYFKRDSLQFEVLWKMSLIMKHNFLAHLGEYLPYRYETRAEKTLKDQLAEKEALIEKLQTQLEVYREINRKN